MPLDAGEIASGGEVRDVDGRLIVVTAGGAPITGGGGGTASTVALDAPTLAALETIDVANLLNPHPVSIATALDISDRTARLLGHVTVDNASLPVTGTFWQATQPVSGTVTANVGTGTQPVSGTVTANAGTGPFPVSDNGGSITVDAPVGTPLRVDPTGTTVQPVSLAAVPTVTEKQDQPAATAATWTSATALNTVVTVATTGYGTANVFVVVPTTVTGGVISLEVSNDGGTTYVPAGAVRVDNGLAENAVALAFAPGINGSRMYAVSVDAMTQVRARLSTVIAGAGNVVVTVSTVAGGIEPFVAVRQRLVATYAAGYRLAAATAAATNLVSNPAANTDKQIATIYHAATATKTVRIRKVSVTILNMAAAIHQIELRQLSAATAPATGNPAITPRPFDSSDAIAEATCLALPTTAGSEAAANSPLSANFAINAGAPTAVANPSGVAGQELVLYDATVGGWDRKPLTLRAGVAEGFAVIHRSSAAAAAFNHTTFIEFTEENP